MQEKVLIDKQAAIDALNDEFTITGKTNVIVIQDYIRRVNLRLHDLPSAQPDIVRCKDCKWYGESLPCADTRLICHKFALNFKPDHYCGCAERRTDEN